MPYACCARHQALLCLLLLASCAGRSIKAGLTACDIVSKWTWAATLLQSSNVSQLHPLHHTSLHFWFDP